MRRKVVRLGSVLRERVDDAAIGGPPANVARSLVQIAVDQVDVRQRDVGQSRATDAGADDVGELGDRLPGLRGQFVGDAGGLFGKRLHFARDDAKRRPRRTGSGSFDPRIEREQSRVCIDVADLVDRIGQHAGQIGDIAGDVLHAVGVWGASRTGGNCRILLMLGR